MKTEYADEMTMRDARKRYFDVNGFGDTGGYDDAWVDFKLGPIPLPFPNTTGRKRAVKYHDFHHILTGFDTDTSGELEISSWEIGAGCKDLATAWIINLSGLAAGVARSPARAFRAFRRGRRESTSYGEDDAAILDSTVRDARARFTPLSGKPLPPATLTDFALFTLAAAAGTTIGIPLFLLFLPLVPIGLVANVLRRRGAAAVIA